MGELVTGKHGHNKITNSLVSDTYSMQTQTCQVCTQEGNFFFFSIQFFYFDVECCLYELFLWVSSLVELFVRTLKNILLSLT